MPKLLKLQFSLASSPHLFHALFHYLFELGDHFFLFFDRVFVDVYTLEIPSQTLCAFIQ